MKPVYVFLIGVGSAAAGLLPWIITGLRLPLQNLWATETTDMPIVLLPFSQYALSLLVAVIVIGSAIAGIVLRATGTRPGLAILGVLVVQVFGLVQTALTVFNGLSVRTESLFYLGALVTSTVVAILLGMLVLLLIARSPRAGVVVGVAIAAVALGPWLNSLVIPFGVVVVPEPLYAVRGVLAVVPPILVGLAIAWAGIRTVGRAIAAAVALLLLIVGPTLIIAVSNAAGSRVLARYPLEMLDYGIGVFRSALGIPELWAPTFAIAILAAGLGLIAQRAAGKQRALVSR